MGNGRIYQCPFYEKRCKSGVCCEGGKMIFPDEATARDHVSSFCANEVAWRRCSIALTLNKYYERRDYYGKSSKGSQRK